MKHDQYTIAELAANPSFIRWTEGVASKQEADYWNRWIEATEKNREIAKKAQQEITGFGFERPALPDAGKEWNKVERDIVENATIRSLLQQKTVQKKMHNLELLFKVAAVLLVGAFVGLAVYLYQGKPASEKSEVAIHSIRTGYSETKTIGLSDGSQIILAANSQLSYKENWLEQPTKRLNLEGEAFFSVVPKKAKTHPKLVVKTEDGTASVWGTRFTVDTYGAGTRVVLEEGKIRIDNNQKEEELTMRPGEMATFSSSSQKIRLKKVNPRVYTSWIEGELFFDHTPLAMLVNRIERTYGVQVKVRDADILEKKLTGSVDFRSLEGLTDAVAEIFDITIQRSGEILIIKHKMNT